MKTLVIIPAFDEAENIAPTVAELRAKFAAGHILVVDDGSRDGTAAAARALGVAVVRHPVNLGAGAAAQTGFRYALAHGFDAAVQHDADGQHDALSIPKLLEPFAADEADVVIGSRYLGPGGYRGGTFRRLGVWLFSVVTSALARQKFTDVTSGQRAFNRRAMATLAELFPPEFPDAEAVLAMRKAGLRLRELAVVMRPRRFGKSKTTAVRTLWYPARALVAVLVEALRKSIPAARRNV